MDEPASIDLTEIYLSLQERHPRLYMYQADRQVFIYRPLGRGEYKKIVNDDRFTDLEREELFCQVCTLWPEGFDFDDCDAGIPTELTKQILKNSFLDSLDRRNKVAEFFRNEMFDLDNQITCIINEAFPQFDLEEIEDWDVEKTSKYLSRAEWKLHNFRGLQFLEPQGAFAGQEELPAPKPAVKTEEVNNRGGQKTKMTPEVLARMTEMKQKFPEIPWDQDAVLQTGDIIPDHFDTTPPAMRPGW